MISAKYLAMVLGVGFLLAGGPFGGWARADAGARLCIHNDTAQRLAFVVESGSKRRVAETAPGAELCLDWLAKQARGVVGVFENMEALEGCSRLSEAGRTERLIGFARFDNCTWQTELGDD